MYRKALPIYNIQTFQYPGKGNYFYVSQAAKHVAKFSFIQQLHKHDHYVTFLCTHGKGIHEINFKIYEVKPGSIFMLSPGQSHTWKLSPDIDGYLLMHTKDFYDLTFASKRIKDYPFFCSNLNTPEIFLKDVDFADACTLFKKIIDENCGELLLRDQKICSLLDLLYIQLTRVYLPKKQFDKANHHYLIKLSKLEDLIETHFMEKKTASFYADKMNISLKHLNRICKITLNKTTSDLITDRLILEAKRMLVHGDYTLEQVATTLGYFDQSHFTRVFKMKSKTTPLDFIKKHRS